MDDADLVEKATIDLDVLITVMHKQGLSYLDILKVFLSRLESLVMQADVENKTR